MSRKKSSRFRYTPETLYDSCQKFCGRVPFASSLFPMLHFIWTDIERLLEGGDTKILDIGSATILEKAGHYHHNMIEVWKGGEKVIFSPTVKDIYSHGSGGPIRYMVQMIQIEGEQQATRAVDGKFAAFLESSYTAKLGQYKKLYDRAQTELQAGRVDLLQSEIRSFYRLQSY